VSLFQDALSTLFALYIRDLGPGVEFGDAHWLGRQGIALALHSIADVLASKDLPVVMTFLISRALVSSLLCFCGSYHCSQCHLHLTFNASHGELAG